jgi:3-oxo-5-alpha-steroid 4-dehydrogenase 1
MMTMANLVPRALATHAWYQKTFPNYPKERKAIFPFLL